MKKMRKKWNKKWNKKSINRKRISEKKKEKEKESLDSLCYHENNNLEKNIQEWNQWVQ